MNCGVAFGLKRVVLSFNKPCTCIRLISRHPNSCAIILRWPGHKFTRYGCVGLGLAPYDIGVCLGRYFSRAILASPTNSEDILLKKLRCAQNALDVLDTVGVHHSVMNISHLMQALQSLFFFRKINRFSAETITSTPAFDALCKSLKSQIRSIQPNETVEALKVLGHFGLNSSSLLIQSLFEIIKHQVNDFSLQEIVYLYFLMGKMESCPVIKALQIALPLVFELQLSIKLDRTNLNQMANMLQFAAVTNASAQSLELLIESLTTLINSGAVINTKTAMTIIKAIVSNHKALQVPEKVLIQRCLTTLADKMEECSFRYIHTIVARLVSKTVETNMQFYNEDFFDKYSAYLVKEDCGVLQACWALKNLDKLYHTNLGLINYVVEKIVADHSQLTDCQPVILLTLVSSLSNAEYEPADMQIIRDLLINHRLFEEGPLELPWMKLGIELAAIGCFSSTLLERIFQEDFLKKFLQRKPNVLLVKLHQAVVTLYPTYRGPFPPQDILDEAIALARHNCINHRKFPLKAALIRGLGGVAYLQTSLFTRSHIYVDHVVVMRKGGFPIALSPPANPDGSTDSVEDLEVPANSQVVVILALNAHCYSQNTKRIRGKTRVQIRCLEALNLTVVPISLQLWSHMPEYERIPFLMQSIKHKCADVSTAIAE